MQIEGQFIGLKMSVNSELKTYKVRKKTIRIYTTKKEKLI
jgi:hypothetical protein